MIRSASGSSDSFYSGSFDSSYNEQQLMMSIPESQSNSMPEEIPAAEKPHVENTVPRAWFFRRSRAPSPPSPSLASSSSPSPSPMSVSSPSLSPVSSSSPSPSPSPRLLTRLFAWWYSQPQGTSTSTSNDIPFDEGKILKNVITADTIARTFFVDDMNITMRITDVKSTPNTLEIDGKLIRWHKQFKCDIPRMLKTEQLFIQGKKVTLEEMPHLNDQEKGEEIVRRIYKLTGGDEEMTYRITSLMCQNTPLFLYHSISRQLQEHHHLTVMQGQGDDKIQDTYYLTRGLGLTPTQPNINLKVTSRGMLHMGVVERPGYPTQFINNPATLNAKEEINLTAGTAQYAYKTQLTPEAVATIYPDPLIRTQNVLRMCMDDIKKGLDAEGLFRVASELDRLDEFTAAFKEDISFESLQDIYSQYPSDPLFAAHLMKRILKLAEAIPSDKKDAFLNLARELEDHQDEGTEGMIQRLRSMFDELPQLKRELLQEILAFFEEVVAHKDTNMMTVQNISSMLSPNLFPTTTPDPIAQLTETSAFNRLGEFLLTHHQRIFAKETVSQPELPPITQN